MRLDTLHEFLDYSIVSGQFYWKVDRGNQFAKVGAKAGYAHNSGYVIIEIEGKQYLAHRLAWLYLTGRWPPAEIDHINRARTCNGWINLREALGFENCQNVGIRSNNKSGYMGVDWHKASKKWRARIVLKGKSIVVGYFDDVTVAAAERVKAKAEYHTFHPGSQ